MNVDRFRQVAKAEKKSLGAVGMRLARADAELATARASGAPAAELEALMLQRLMLAQSRRALRRSWGLRALRCGVRARDARRLGRCLRAWHQGAHLAEVRQFRHFFRAARG
jgi:hypothetical protein